MLLLQLFFFSLFLYQLTTRRTMKNEQRNGKGAYCTYSLQLHCPWLNEIPAVGLIFINNLHVHSRPLYIGEELSHFYFSLCYVQSIPPEIGLHYSLCGV